MKKKAKKTVAKSPPKRFKAGFYSNPRVIPQDFAIKLRQLEKEIKKRIVLLWHDGSGDEFAHLEDLNYLNFAHNIRKLKPQEPIAVVINSPGGSARAAFKLASLLLKHCGSYSLVVPYFAKSAATLFALGADKIIMSKFAELGPLDAQILDREKEERFSALEVVQSIERLNSEAMKAVDQNMLFWLGRSKKKVDTLLPLATHFVSEIMQPLFDKIDSVNFTGMARILKVAEDYAKTLLQKRGLSEEKATIIADRLTNAYSEHEYVIDCDELRKIGLDNVEEATGNMAQIMEDIVFLGPSQGALLGPLEVI